MNIGGMWQVGRIRQHAALMFRVFVEDIDAGADNIVDIKSGIHRLQGIAVIAHQGVGRPVHIGHHKIAINHHDRGHGIVHRRLQTRDLYFVSALFGHIEPFQRVTDVIAFVVNLRRDVDIEDQLAHVNIRGVRQIGRIGQHATLVRRVLVENVDAGANNIFDIEAGVDARQRIAVTAQQLACCIVDIGHHQVTVDHHDRRHGATYRRSPARNLSLQCCTARR